MLRCSDSRSGLTSTVVLGVATTGGYSDGIGDDCRNRGDSLNFGLVRGATCCTTEKELVRALSYAVYHSTNEIGSGEIGVA